MSRITPIVVIERKTSENMSDGTRGVSRFKIGTIECETIREAIDISEAIDAVRRSKIVSDVRFKVWLNRGSVTLDRDTLESISEAYEAFSKEPRAC